MARLRTFTSWRAGVIFSAALVTSAAAGEKVRFGSLKDLDVPTQPTRSMRETIEAESHVSINSAAPASMSVPVAASGGSTVTRSRAGDEDERDWIFNDTSTAKGIQRALGVETFDEAAPTVADRDSVAVIQDYFSRQRSQSAGVTPDGVSRPGMTSSSGTANPFGTSGILGGNSGLTTGTGDNLSGKILGASNFRETLNSDNAVVRRYYRSLYTSPGGSSPFGSGASTPGNAIGAVKANPFAKSSSSDSTAEQNFDNLAGKAALVNSLSSQTAEDPRAKSPAEIASQRRETERGLPVVNQGNLFEKRNGVIEIPGRKF